MSAKAPIDGFLILGRITIYDWRAEWAMVLSQPLEMMPGRKLNWLFAYQAVVYAAGLLLATGLVPDWGAWYSSSLPYRTQTEALLKGDLAVSRNVADLKFDHTWSEQGVQQVWGLGVPLWRLPFEAGAKLFGFDGFPDRIEFGLFALLVSFVVLKVWVGAPASGPAREGGCGFSETASPGTSASVNPLPDVPSAVGASDTQRLRAPVPLTGWQLITGFGAGFLILLLFPPFLTLLQVRGAVWEEAVAYEYLFAVLQLSLLIAYVRRPTKWRLFFVCGLAGLGGTIRPTLVFYGFGTVVIATAVWVFCKVVQAPSLSLKAGSSRGDEALTSEYPRDRRDVGPTLGRILTAALTAIFLFCLGGGLLWLTNLKRFGDGFEFGHRLNVQTLYGSMYATRFDYPFADEPLVGAAKELSGALFLESKFNGGDWYQKKIFSGQSPTVRWREFYFRTYDWSYIPLLLFGWAAALVTLWSRGARAARPHCPAPSRDNFSGADSPAGGRIESAAAGAPGSDPASEGGGGFSETASPGTNASTGKGPSPGPIAHLPSAICDPLPLLTLGFWSLFAVVPLAAFYLYTPVISSRYLMDLAPAFAAAIAGAWLFIAARCQRRWSRVLACLLLCGWTGLELYLSRSIYGAPASVTASELKVLREHRPAAVGSTTNSPVADDYGQSLNGDRTSVPFDRTGWNRETGAVKPLVILFVKDPEFLELDFATQPHPRIAASPEDIRAKVGLEFLELQKITKTDQGWRVRFRGPQQARWRTGLQVAFVATVPKEFLAERTTPWVLKSVRWRDGQK